jgi:hypothetical protein
MKFSTNRTPGRLAELLRELIDAYRRELGPDQSETEGTLSRGSEDPIRLTGSTEWLAVALALRAVFQHLSK